MAKTCNQKAKILYLERMLWETGEKKALSMQEILARLEGYGIRAERKSIYDDMAVLRAFGMKIEYRRGSQGGYYLAADCGEDALQREMFEKYRGNGEAQDAGAKAPDGETAGAEEAVSEVLPSARLNLRSTDARAGKIKLLFHNSVRSEVEHILGTDCVYKEKGADYFTAAAKLTEDSQLYGWLVSMGKNVQILKPVKTALAYRNFLKGIAKEYKGIEK